jgi:serine/threonine protein kinase
MRLSRLAGKHTNIAPVHESGHIDGIHYIAMEFVSGRSLHKLVQDEGPMSVEQAAFIGMEAALALHHVHLQGLVHRDVKPANIVISSKGQVRLIDFGLAMQENEPEADESVVGGQGFIVGTMDYIAPEQTFDPSKVDARADIYGLGCSLYYALTGKPPFQGGTSLERMRRHRNDDPEPLSKLRPDLPQGFLGLIAAMMEKDPNQRIAPAGLLAADLKLWTPGDHVFEMVKTEGDDVSRLRMYHPEEISDLEKQLLADDTGSEPKSESHAEMHDPTEVETAVR